MLGAWWQQIRRNWMDYPLRQGAVWAGRYRIELLLGMGSYGQAYRCTDLMTGMDVLLKRAKPSKRDAARMMLAQESGLMRQLDHPQMPKWLGEATHRGETALVMAYIEGDNLEQLIMAQDQTYTQRGALLVVRELLGPLKHLHEAGYVHRDVRIPNVIASGDRICLLDLGLACRIGEESPNPWRQEEDDDGPSGFADSWGPVKQRMRDPYPASDLYGLGHLFLFLMYSSYQASEGQEERGWEEELELEPAIKDFVRGLLDKRWQTAAECERELALILERTDETSI